MADRIVVMNAGVIEQVGSPLEVYRKPASAFVADFVGTTNFLPAVVVRPGVVRFGPVDLACGIDIQPGPGNDVTLAIRPEDMVVRNVSAGGANTVAVKVTDIEFLGAFCRVVLTLSDGVSKVLGDFSINVVRDLAVEEGMELLISLPADRIRVFPATSKTP